MVIIPPPSRLGGARLAIIGEFTIVNPLPRLERLPCRDPSLQIPIEVLKVTRDRDRDRGLVLMTLPSAESELEERDLGEYFIVSHAGFFEETLGGIVIEARRQPLLPGVIFVPSLGVLVEIPGVLLDPFFLLCRDTDGFARPETLPVALYSEQDLRLGLGLTVCYSAVGLGVNGTKLSCSKSVSSK
jgi:hypothetical protein